MNRIKEILIVLASLGLGLYFLFTSYSNLFEAETQSRLKKTIELKSQLRENTGKEEMDLKSRTPISPEEAQWQFNCACIVIAFVLTGTVCGLFAGRVASTKGYSYDNWFFAGFFFSFVGLIASVGIAKKDSRTEEE